VTNVQPIRMYSHSRCATDDNCQRERFLSREWGGTGLQPLGSSAWNLEYGTLIHSGMEDLALKGSIDYMKYRAEALGLAQRCGFDLIQARQWAAIAEGQLRGVVRSIWPGLMAEYEVAGGELWVNYDRPNGMRFRARQDLLLKSRYDGHYCMVDYKTTSSNKPRWVKSWNKSIQMHSSIHALRKCCDVPIDRCIVIGFYKGYENERTKEQQSVFSTGYVNRQFAMVPTYSYEFQRSRGWEKFSTFDEFPNMEEWVAKMPEEHLSSQFIQTAPIPYREDIATEWFIQQDIREEEVDAACKALAAAESNDEVNDILRRHFKQNFSKCEPGWGYDCQFKDVCWIKHVSEDPLGSGRFQIYRADHEETM
jgi:hypothetical protein